MKKMIYALALFYLVYAQKHNQDQRTLQNSETNSPKTKNRIIDIPKTLSYQGLLTKENGRPVNDGDYQITFRFYPDSIEGELIWQETQMIKIEDGVISATLGLQEPVDFSSAEAFLEIIIDDVPLLPRQAMTSVFYSMKSDTSNYSQGGNYNDLDNLPDLSVYAKKDTLSNFSTSSSFDSVAFTGDYNDLSNTPDLSGFSQSDTLNYFVMSDSLNYYTLSSDLSAVALSNNYDDLNNLPDLSVYANNDTLSNFLLIDSVGTMASQDANNVAITGG